jgi:L-histidine N-alpha-methyltransferase
MILDHVRGGLSRFPKKLPACLFYDDIGSRLYEQITSLPEYYLTRTERSILEANAVDIVRQAAARRSRR